jgi:hypothetical protein
VNHKKWLPGWRQPELQLVEVEVEKTKEEDRVLPNESVVDVLRDARRDGMFFVGRKYRTRLAKLVQIFRERNTPEFFVAAQELEDMLIELRGEEPVKLDE